jgi:hypothetical protein
MYYLWLPVVFPDVSKDDCSGPDDDQGEEYILYNPDPFPTEKKDEKIPPATPEPKKPLKGRHDIN